MSGRLATVLLALAATAGPAAAIPDDDAAAPPSRPRVCLVLSGGGALGIAHVAVLRVLEELRVPVDCIAGTSMGALVGGLYAAGYSGDELERIASELDWSDLLRDAPDRRALPYRRKVDDFTYLTRWELGFSEGRLKTPSALIPGHKLGLELRLLCLRAAGVADFDRLAPSFRAVATDARTGEAVVLSGGDLATALRASMAVPGLFSPVEIGERLLVDGGLVANLPVDAARAMGAEVVIAVDLGQPLASQERPESMAGILGRTTSFLTRLNVERALADADVVIRPDLSGYRLLDFDRAAELLARGGAAARAQADVLSRWAVGEAEWGEYLGRRTPAAGPVEVTALTLDPGPGLVPGAVARMVRTRPGGRLDPELLREDVRRLYQTGEFETVDFTLQPYREGVALTITGHAKSWGPNFLRFGLGLSSDLEGSSQLNALAAYTMTRVNRLGAEFKATAQLGDVPIASVELYQPLSTSRVPFFSAQAAANDRKSQLPIDGESVQYRFTQQSLGLDLGVALGRFGELRAGVRRYDTVGRATHGSSRYPDFDRTDAGFNGSLVIDQIDRVNFPTSGVLLVAEAYEARRGLGADDDYRRAGVQFVGAATVRRHTLIGLFHATSALGGILPESERVYLGGLFNLSGLPPGEVSGSYGGAAGLIYLFRLGKLPTFGDGFYAGVSLETGNAWAERADVDLSDLRRSFTVTFGADTLLGPVYLAHGWTSGGKDSFYLYLGRTF